VAVWTAIGAKPEFLTVSVFTVLDVPTLLLPKARGPPVTLAVGIDLARSGTETFPAVVLALISNVAVAFAAAAD
jgi:hypothetical protein